MTTHCNCNGNLIPSGNDFFLAIALKSRSLVDGEVVETPFDFEAADTYNARIYGILDGTTLSTMVGLKDGTTDTVVIDAKGVPLIRAIGVEVTGTVDGRAFRAAEKGFLSIVEFNGEAKVVFTPVTGGQEANLVMVLTFLPSAAVVGKNAYEIWKEEPGNQDKTLADFIYFLGHGESAYEIAVRYGYTGTEAEYNMLYFDAVDVANTAGQNAQQAADTANEMAAQAQDAAELANAATTNANNAATAAAATVDAAIDNMEDTLNAAIAAQDAEIASKEAEIDEQFATQTALINQKQMEIGAVPSDLTPTAGSTNWVTSGGIKDALRADNVSYNNSLNRYTEDNVQRAVDELRDDDYNLLSALGMSTPINIISSVAAKNVVTEYTYTINKGDRFRVKVDKGSGVTGYSVSTRNGSTTAETIFYNINTNQDVVFEALKDADRFAVYTRGGTINLRIDSVGKNIEIDDVPTSGSNKPVKSGGIYGTTVGIDNSVTEADLEIKDENHNVLVLFQNGHIRTKEFDSSKISDISIADNENFDFTVEDENGYAVVLFQRGHIRTKNFNSETFSAANFLKDKFQGKKIAIIGDSISTYQGWLPSDVAGFSGSTYDWYYPRGDVDSVDKTWWYQVAQNLGIPDADIANTSWSGSRVCGDSTSITNGHAGCSTKRINDIAIHGYIPDIIIVYIGCNDWYQCGLSGYNITLGTWAITDAVPAEGTIDAFRSAYALMLAKIQNAYPSSRIFCCTILDDWRRDAISDDDSDNAWPSNDGAGYTTKQWNDNIKEIADAFACDVIDLHNCGITYFNIQQHYAVDAGLHPNAAGHALMARKVTSELMAKY